MLHLFVLLAALMIMISTQSMCLHCQVLLPLKPEKDAMCFESDILAKLFDHLRLLLKKKKTPRRISHGISGPQHAWWTTLTGPKNATRPEVLFGVFSPHHPWPWSFALLQPQTPYQPPRWWRGRALPNPFALLFPLSPSTMLLSPLCIAYV